MYKVVPTQDNKWVAVNTKTNVPVSRSYENKTQALKIASQYSNGELTEEQIVSNDPVTPSLTVSDDLVNSFKPTHTAVGMFQGTDGVWIVAEFPFDPKSGQAGQMKVERAGIAFQEGEHKFKVVVGQKVLKRA